MVYYSQLNASNKQVYRFDVDLAKTIVPVGSTSDTLGLVLANLTRIIPNASVLRVKLAGIKAVTAVSGGGSTSALSVFLQKNGGNNVEIPSSGSLTLTVGGGAVAVGTRDLELGEEVATKIHVYYPGLTAESFKLILAATGAATIPGTTKGIIEVLVELEYSAEGLPHV